MATTIPELFDACVRRDPDAVALIHDGRRVSYGELAGLADRYLGQLRAAGLRRGDVVAVCRTRTVDVVAALLAVLRAGAAYTCLDPRWPEARRRQILERLSPRLVLHTEAIPGSTTWWPDPAAAPASTVDGAAATAEDTAIVFFTSGSTGAPKAVALPHRSFTRLFEECEFASYGPGVVLPQFMPMHWDGSVLDLWGSLLCGGTSVLVDEVLQPALVRRLIDVDGVNAVGCLPPALFNMLVDEDVAALAGLRFIGLGGERVSAPHVRRFAAAHPETVVTNVYGPAECGVLVTARQVCEADTTDPAGVPLGRPVAGSLVLVLDGERRCAPGETGELCLGGPGLASGYLGDPERTAERFVTVSIDGIPTRVYRTGDLGHYDESGLLYFAGRGDNQVKIRSHRIEPGEIERTAEAMAGVASAVVVPVAGPDGNPHALALYYASDSALEPAELARALRAQLPEYLVPQHFQRLERLPLTLNNKVDRGALRALAAELSLAGPAGQPEAVETADPTDPRAVVAAAFRQLAGAASGSPADGAANGGADLASGEPAGDADFFALGASSLEAARLCARISAALGVTIPVSQVYRTPTIDTLTAWLTTPAGQPDASEPAAGGQIALISGQSGAAFVAPTSVCLIAWSIEGALDRSALAAALADLHARHQSLHANYHLTDPPYATLPATVPAVPFAELPEAADAAEARAALTAELLRPIDISTEPVWRAATVQSDDRVLFGIGVHHVAFDGWSQALLIEELGTAYAARLGGAAPQWEQPAPTLEALVAEERRRLAGIDLAAQQEYWTGQLRRLSRLPLPGLAQGLPSAWGPKTGGVFPLTGADLAEWDRAAGAAGAGRFAYHAAILAEALRRITGHAEVGLLVPVAVRGSLLLDTALACRTDPVVLRLRRPIRPGDDPLVPVVQAVNTALANQDVPFGSVLRGVAMLRPDLDSIVNLPTFVLQDNARPGLRLPGCVAEELVEPYAYEVQAALTVEVYPQPEDPMLRVTVRTDLLDPALIDQLGAAYLDVLLGGPGALDTRVAATNRAPASSRAPA